MYSTKSGMLVWHIIMVIVNVACRVWKRACHEGSIVVKRWSSCQTPLPNAASCNPSRLLSNSYTYSNVRGKCILSRSYIDPVKCNSCLSSGSMRVYQKTVVELESHSLNHLRDPTGLTLHHASSKQTCFSHAGHDRRRCLQSLSAAFWS